MTATGHPVILDLVERMRRAAAETDDPTQMVSRLKEPARQAALNSGWIEPRFREIDPEQGFAVDLLHEESDHSLALYCIAWMPGRGVPAHNHGTWAVVAGIEGHETNILYRRTDDGTRPGFCDLEEAECKVVGPGDVVAMLPSDIHSVRNDGSEVALSLHIYGKHLNHTGRSQFDPETHTEAPYPQILRSREIVAS